MIPAYTSDKTAVTPHRKLFTVMPTLPLAHSAALGQKNRKYPSSFYATLRPQNDNIIDVFI